jgi:PAS domain S-box-containing protein
MTTSANRCQPTDVATDGPAERSATTVRHGDLALDPKARTVTVRGARIDLTRLEFDLLDTLASNPNRVFTRDQLLRSVWQSDAGWQSPATVTEHVRRLRRKLGPNEAASAQIATVIGVGYRFEPSEVADDPEAGADEDEGSTHCFVIVNGSEIVAASRTAVDLLGGDTDADLVGHQILEFIAATSMDAAQRRIESRAADDFPRPETMRLLRMNGSEVRADVASTPITYAGRPHTQVNLWARPDDDRARLRRIALGISSEVTDAVIILDPSLRIRSLNAAAERLYGCVEADAIDKHLRDVIPWTADRAEQARIAEILVLDGHWHGDLERARTDSGTTRVHVSVAMMGEEVGHHAGIVMVSRPNRTTATMSADEADLSAQVGPAIDAGEFLCHYQPIVHLDTRRVIGVEALARWNHPTRGVLGPERFLPTAESTGDIVRLGRRLLEEACAQVAAWRDAGLEIDLAVNISAQQLLEGVLVEDIDSILSDTGLAPEQLLVEITETALIVDVNRAAHLLTELSDRQVRVAIDDFGTGWASLTYLKRFPVHALKIDRTFTLGLNDTADDVAIIRSILSLGNELDLVVIAEGIETIEQETAMRQLGCWLGQGYLYAQPHPAAEVAFSIAD